MNVRCLFVLLVSFVAIFASDTNAFISLGVSSFPADTASKEKPTISLSCLLYGDTGCMKACQLTSLLYDASINPKCVDNKYCMCNEVYHLQSGDLTTTDFQALTFDSLWDNIFENSSQANAIRRYIKKNPEMSLLVDGLIRDPHVSGEEVKNQLMFTYPDLSSEFKKLIPMKRGLKTDLMSGDHLKYEDILDSFNDLVSGIQSSDNELQNIKYKRRMGKILESVNDESELSHLVDLVKLSKDESLYNYVTSVLKKRGYVLEGELEEAIPIVGIFSNGPEDQVSTSSIIREHNLGVNDINEGDMIELSVITNLAKPRNTQGNNQQPQSQVDMPQVQTQSLTYTETTAPGNGNDNNVLVLTDVLAKMQTEIANLGKELSQLKNSSLGVGLDTRNLQTDTADQTVSSGINLSGISDVLNSNFGTQSDSNFENKVSTLLNTVLNSGTSTPDASQIEFFNNIPKYMAQVSNAPVSFPNGVSVSKSFASNSPTNAGVSITPDAVEDSVLYTISKKVRMLNDKSSSAAQPKNDNQNVGVTIYNSANTPDTATDNSNVGVTIYNSPDTATDSNVGVTIYNSPDTATDNSNVGVTIYDSATDSPSVGVTIYDSANAPNTVTIATEQAQSDAGTPGSQILISTNNQPEESRDSSLVTGNFSKNRGSSQKPSSSNDSPLTTGNFSKNEASSQQLSSTTDSTVNTGNFSSDGASSSVDTGSPAPLEIKISQTQSAASDNIPNDTVIQVGIPTTESVTVKNVSPKKTKVISTNTTKNKIAATETAVPANANSPDVVKVLKGTRKSNTANKESKIPAQAESEILQVNVLPSSMLDTVVSNDSELEDVKLDDVPVGVQNGSNLKRKRTQANKNAETSESSNSVRSFSKTSSTVQTEDSNINVSMGKQTETTSSTTKEENTRSNFNFASAIDENASKQVSLPVIPAEEPSSPFSRFGLDHVRRFANSFKKS